MRIGGGGDEQKRERGQVTQRGSRKAKTVPRVLAASTTRASARSASWFITERSSVCGIMGSVSWSSKVLGLEEGTHEGGQNGGDGGDLLAELRTL